jgi:hypothetical protein
MKHVRNLDLLTTRNDGRQIISNAGFGWFGVSENEVYPKKNQLNGNIIMNHEILGYHMFNQTHLYKRMRCLRFALTWRNIHSLWPLSSGKWWFSKGLVDIPFLDKPYNPMCTSQNQETCGCEFAKPSMAFSQQLEHEAQKHMGPNTRPTRHNLSPFGPWSCTHTSNMSAPRAAAKCKRLRCKWWKSQNEPGNPI